MHPARLLYRHLRRRGVEFDSLAGDLLERVSRLDAVFPDLAAGAGAPPGFHPDRFLAPGVPRIRPLLVLLSAEAARQADAATPGGADELATVAELLHVAILVHDAALGRQGGRRRRAARRLVGGAVGWLGGNHLTLRALELARHESPEILADLLETLREISEGHALTQALQGRHATPAEALSHAENHTGVVFAFSCRAGARLAHAERPVVTGLSRYGRHAGVAWHLAEDLSVLEQEGEDLLQALEDRAAYGRPMLPISLGAERDPAIAELWTALGRPEEPSRRDEGDLAAELARRVRASGGVQEGRLRLAQTTWRARRALQVLPPTPHREALDRLAAGLAR